MGNASPASRNALIPPLSAGALVDRYFLEQRGKLLEVAAFLDRVSRAADYDAAAHDHRIAALLQAAACLQDGQGQRTQRMLELLSDTSTQATATTSSHPASGAPRPPASEGQRDDVH